MSANGNGIDGLILNGLRGADLVVFNVLYLARNRQLSGLQIADLTTYHPNTVYGALDNLESLELIERRRDCRGQKYTFILKG
jgi:DNA-binding MarR family transcriptional regulator